MKVIGTGAAGQLGTSVLRHLLDEQDVSAVRALDLRPSLRSHRKLEGARRQCSRR
jgi:uncharacterized protein YbjT (DUF2867 family)